MKRKTVLILLVLCLMVTFGCSEKGSFLITMKETKVTAEEALYYSRVAYNKGKLSETQFTEIRKTYDVLRELQHSAIDARIEYLKLPDNATAEAKYLLAQKQVVEFARKFTLLAISLGILAEGQEIDPIPIRKF